MLIARLQEPVVLVPESISVPSIGRATWVALLSDKQQLAMIFEDGSLATTTLQGVMLTRIYVCGIGMGQHEDAFDCPLSLAYEPFVF